MRHLTGCHTAEGVRNTKKKENTRFLRLLLNLLIFEVLVDNLSHTAAVTSLYLGIWINVFYSDQIGFEHIHYGLFLCFLKAPEVTSVCLCWWSMAEFMSCKIIRSLLCVVCSAFVFLFFIFGFLEWRFFMFWSEGPKNRNARTKAAIRTGLVGTSFKSFWLL